jgi:hypothetical protein
MALHARVKDGLVAEILDWPADAPQPISECFHPDIGEWIDIQEQDPKPEERWLYNDSKFEEPPSPVSLAVASPSVTKRQILLWLLKNKQKTEQDVISAIDGIPDQTQRETVKINWTYPDGPFSREDPLFDQLGVSFGMSPEDIDTAFSEGAGL